MSRRALTGFAAALLPGGLMAPTVRLRLSALYGWLFFASSTAMLAITYAALAESRPAVRLSSLLTSRQLAEARTAALRILGGQRAAAAARGLVAAERAETLHRLLVDSGASLVVMSVVSAWLGWLVAGRVLRPLRVMTTKARQISEQNLHERLAVGGPSDELRKLGETIDGLLTRLESAFSAQRLFVANASHELRTPLTLERAMVEVALADPEASAETLRATCERVLAASGHQEQIIDALLTLARCQSGLDRNQPFHLDQVAADVLAVRQRDAERLGLRVGTSLARAPAVGDVTLVERLVANLVDNAVTHNVEGGWLTVHTSVKEGQARLLVANSGPVIASGELDRLLRPFERLGTDRTGQRAGLGLAIVQAIAEVHGAALTLRPPPGGGLEVDVAFPMSPPGRPPVPPPSPPAHADPGAPEPSGSPAPGALAHP
jgi:signal transduction histidine kinase